MGATVVREEVFPWKNCKGERRAGKCRAMGLSRLPPIKGRRYIKSACAALCPWPGIRAGGFHLIPMAAIILPVGRPVADSRR